MKTIVLNLAALAMSVSVSANTPPAENGPNETMKVDTKASTVYWTGKKVTGEHTGTIMIKDGTVELEGNAPTSATIVMDMNSIAVTDLKDPDTNQKLVGHLKSPDFFGVEKNPTGKFVAKSITPIAGAKGEEPNYTLNGKLTLKGKTHDLSFPAHITVKDGMIEASGNLTFDRSKYDIRYGSDSFFEGLGDKVIYDDVELSFELKASK